MTAHSARISRFGEYRGYSSPGHDGRRHSSQHVPLRDGTRIAIDFFGHRRALDPDRIRVTVTCADEDTFATPVLDPAPQVVVLRGPTRPSHIVLLVIPQSPA